MTELNPKLSICINNVLIASVDHCAQYVKLKDRGTLKRCFDKGKWILQGENQIKSGLDSLKILAAQKDGIQSTLMLEGILKSQKKLDEIAFKGDAMKDQLDDYISNRTDEQRRQEDLTKIRTKFGMAKGGNSISLRPLGERPDGRLWQESMVPGLTSLQELGGSNGVV